MRKGPCTAWPFRSFISSIRRGPERSNVIEDSPARGGKRRMAEVILHMHMSSPSPDAAIIPSEEVSSMSNCGGMDSQGNSDRKMVEDVAERPEPLKDIKVCLPLYCYVLLRPRTHYTLQGDFAALIKHNFKFPATYVYYKN